MGIERMIDANLNRVSEGLRVIEDCLRFVYEDDSLQERVRKLKHSVRKTLESDKYIHSRNASEDVGLEVSSNSILDQKSNLNELMAANFKRVQEGLRTIEESLKVLGLDYESKQFERMRFNAYVLEKDCVLLNRYPSSDLYAILSEKLSHGRSNVDVAEHLMKSGIKILQYREKHKTKRERLSECMEIRKITKEAGCFFIINDDLDIALTVGADGLHLGQDDLPIELARKLAPHLVIGVSTHNPGQAREAVESGADYIGVGPVFATQTKLNVEASDGLKYVEWVSENIPVPHVAIGGINADNIQSVRDSGGKSYALISELVSAKDIKGRVEEIRKQLIL